MTKQPEPTLVDLVRAGTQVGIGTAGIFVCPWYALETFEAQHPPYTPHEWNAMHLAGDGAIIGAGALATIVAFAVFTRGVKRALEFAYNISLDEK